MRIRFDRIDTLGGYEDVLRSLGAVLDAYHARSVEIRELADGLMVRALVVETLDERLTSAWKPLERLFTLEAIRAERERARARRGTGHVAGPMEQSLRLVGRQLDERHLDRITLIQHHTNDGWMVWHGGPCGGRAELFSMTAGELNTMDAMVRAQAGRLPAVPHL